MKPNEFGESSSTDWVEEALRRLPTPEVPAGLNDRLIAMIPVASRNVQPNRVVPSSPRWRRVFIAIAACIAVVCFGPLWMSRKQSLPSDNPMRNILMMSGFDSSERTIEIHFEGETDPCNILGTQLY